MSTSTLIASLASLPAPELDCVMNAISSGALLYEHKGERYAARWDGLGWWIWRLLPGSTEHFVSNVGCSCDAAKPCKHMNMIRCGSH